MEYCIQDNLTSDWLEDYLKKLVDSGDKLAAMKQQLDGIKRENATAKLADLIEQTISERS
jgi:UDP-N-acetylglucosamine:LPS N-acetylglucosamine transferase